MNAIRARVFAALIVSAATITLIAQEPRRASVMTVKGDVVEGILKSVSGTEAVIEVAGQSLRIPITDVKYISFVGKIESGEGGAAAPAVDPMKKALDALQSLRAATEIGMLRTQYAQKLIETLPAVKEFAKPSSTSDWLDVRLAMASAAADYQLPLSSLDAWQRAEINMTRAAAAVAYAAKLIAQPGEQNHKEDREVRTIRPGEELTGRLGYGDQPMPRSLDVANEGGFNDVFNFVVESPQRFEVSMKCTCDPQLTVALAGKLVRGASGVIGPAKTKFDAAPNRYEIWAGAQPGHVGEYVLTITPTK